MKKNILVSILIALVIGLIAQDTTPLQDYFADPSTTNMERVISNSQSLLGEDKTNTEAHLNLMLIHSSEMFKAMNNMEENFDKLSNFEHFQLANTYLSIGQEEASLKHYDVLNEQSPNWSCPWRHKCEALYNLGRYDEAKVAVVKAIEARIEHYDAYLWLAMTEIKLGKKKKALKAFENAMFYKGKDTEDPEEEFSSESEKFLKLEIYKLNKKKGYKQLRKDLLEQYPENKHWNK